MCRAIDGHPTTIRYAGPVGPATMPFDYSVLRAFDPMQTARPDTVMTHAGLEPHAHHGIVNPPVYHASTVLFPTLDALEHAGQTKFDSVYYGRVGTPTTSALETAVALLEGGHRAIVAGSGLAAITTTLYAFLKTGDHILVTDSVYAPTRLFCDQMLVPMGVRVEYYDPHVGAGIAALLRPETRVVFAESPGSLTFEVQDIPAMAEAIRSAGRGDPPVLITDNTWASPLYFKPFAHGAHVSVHAATKYIVGHSDAMLGLIVCDEAHFHAVKQAAVLLGTCAGPDDVWLGLRGLRTMGVRLARHWETGLALAEWLATRPEVVRVLHPARPGDPGHALWRRDFTGASGLFSVLLKPAPRTALAAMLDHMRLFGMGYSWGGFESLIIPAKPQDIRSVTSWEEPGPLLRLHAGLEDASDLIADLRAGLDRYTAAKAA